ncbi:MAG: 2-oxoglutarate and iron-dependent oxygenase domain-containing protein [Pseudomonadota bacterium]
MPVHSPSLAAHNAIPVIDLKSGDRAAVVAQIRQACEEIGFFVVAGHCVPEDLVDRMAAVSRAQFDRPEAEKRRVAEVGEVIGGFSYVPLLHERLAATSGEATPGDLKETLDYGPGFPAGPWPEELAQLKAVWLAYYQAMSGFCGELRALFALALGLEADFFDDKFIDHLSSIRVINYPAPTAPFQPGQLRAGAHRDYGFLTVLRSEDKPGGLEVRNRAGQWVAPPALPGTFVVNIGDALMRWTNDHWVSTPHRVVPPPPEDWQMSRRQSIAFFHNPARDALIECLPGFGDGTARYAPITYGAYGDLRYRQARARN